MGVTAAAMGLLSCRACGLVVKPLSSDGDGVCPRCKASLHHRKPNSLSRTWALVIASAILYIPANLFPMMETTSVDGTRRDTILSGIGVLWSSGSWLVAVIVFVASILVPLLKIVVLTALLVAVQRPVSWSPAILTRLYRLLELVGRWSMLDIYVVTILTALVQFPYFAKVTAGPAALPFGAVVVLTMVAAMQFDPRLLWDVRSAGNNHD